MPLTTANNQGMTRQENNLNRIESKDVCRPAAKIEISPTLEFLTLLEDKPHTDRTSPMQKKHAYTDVKNQIF